MSTRDEAALSDAERAALAGLETKAEADDPRLAAQLRGRRRRRTPTIAVPPFVLRTREVLERGSHTVLGPLVAVAGLVLAVLTLSISVPLALVGVALLVAGLVMSSVLVRATVEQRRAVLAPPTPPGTGRGNGPLSSF
jgi:Flp pilus assembly protein TadB